MEFDLSDLKNLLRSRSLHRQSNHREYALLALGFSYSENKLKQYISRALCEGDALACRQGVYYRLSDVSGAQFWVRTQHLGQVSGVDVFFEGETSTPFGLEDIRMDDDYDPLDGGFYGWSQAVADSSGDPETPFTGDFPTAFGVPDFARHLDLPLPALRAVQYAAFAKGISAFVDESDFSLRSPWKIASRSFFPVDELNSWVTFAGEVLDCGMRRNGISGREFAWAKVQAYGATLDVAANPRTVRGTLVPGGYVMGHFWLRGRLL